jgi:tRNA 2-selenouridine synthase
MHRLDIIDFLKTGKESKIIDVRSPAEYSKGHIPGAVNIPIFSDLERAKVGTTYKQQSREEAISLGLEIVGPKLKDFAAMAKQEATNNELYVYCWRGGMRSAKMAWLFELVGINTSVLEGGYKSYRSQLLEVFKNVPHLVVLQGPTGSGKTEILKEMQELGVQVVDLEGIAHHKGSAFGGLGQGEQPTTQQFQNDVYDAFLKLDLSAPIWVESESATIGRVYLPETLWQLMNSAKIVSIEIPRAERIENIIRQYGDFPADVLCERVEQLAQRLGGAAVKEAVAYIKNGDLAEAVDLLLTYYDKSYSHSFTHHKERTPIKLKLESGSALDYAKLILDQTTEKII